MGWARAGARVGSGFRVCRVGRCGVARGGRAVERAGWWLVLAGWVTGGGGWWAVACVAGKKKAEKKGRFQLPFQVKKKTRDSSRKWQKKADFYPWDWLPVFAAEKRLRGSTAERGGRFVAGGACRAGGWLARLLLARLVAVLVAGEAVHSAGWVAGSAGFTGWAGAGRVAFAAACVGAGGRSQLAGAIQAGRV